MNRFRILVAAVAYFVGAAAPGQVTSIGLSSVRAQRFGNDFGPTYPATDGDRYGSVFAVGDFNGDGADDLVAGIPEDDGAAGAEIQDAGLVVIRYGSPGGGLSGSLDFLWRGALPDAEAGDYFGFALAVCDFDGDGFDDLAVGAPEEAFGALEEAGAVFVFYAGSGTVQTLDQDTPGMPDEIEAFDNFGFALACGDFDLDGEADLVISAKFETIVQDFLEGGAVYVVPGSPTGLEPSGAIEFHQDSPGIDDVAEGGDQFGSALAAGDFDGDGFADLAIGVPGEDGSSGALHVLFGSDAGLDASREVFLDESGVGGLSEDQDRFAETLAVGDFDGDGEDDLAIGVPFEAFGTGNAIDDAGQAVVLYGSVTGIDFARTQFWSQNSILGGGTTEVDDLFGASFAAGDFDRDGRDDLAIGAPGEFVTGVDDGAFTVIVGSAAGLTNARHRGLAAGFEGIPGDTQEHFKRFSLALAAGDFDGDGHADLAVGAPSEDEGGFFNTGSVTALYGSLFADGFEPEDAGLWSGVAQ
ncbi:MAG: hypothetical protein AMXMBFR36_18740 [Acidobacteriota bacterium]